MIRTEPRRSRLFALSEDHFYVEEQPQIVLPEVPHSIRLAQPTTILEEEDEDEDTEQYLDVDDVPLPARTLHIFVGGQALPETDDDTDEIEPPMLNGAFVFPVGAGLPDADLSDEEDQFEDEPSLVPPPFSMPTPLSSPPLRLLNPSSPSPIEAEPEGFPIFAVGIAAAGMAIAVGMLWM
ncbi:MAG: hypothetical protein ACI8RZ_005029 [Myxococcota bacterium]|jgi:hypothetical protein